MKAIIITFNGDFTNQKELARTIAELLLKSPNVEVKDNLSMSTLVDAEVANALMKAIPTSSKPNKILNSELLCKTLISIVGSPALMTEGYYKLELLKKIQEEENVKLRNPVFWRVLKNLSENDKQILKFYGFSNLPSWLPDIKTIFKLFDYGEI